MRVRIRQPAARVALRLDGGVPAEVTQERSALLRALSAEKAQLHAQRRAGAAADAIVVRAGDRMDAMTEDFLTLPINGARRVRGDRFPARISDAGAALTPV